MQSPGGKACNGSSPVGRAANRPAVREQADPAGEGLSRQRKTPEETAALRGSSLCAAGIPAVFPVRSGNTAPPYVRRAAACPAEPEGCGPVKGKNGFRKQPDTAQSPPEWRRGCRGPSPEHGHWPPGRKPSQVWESEKTESSVPRVARNRRVLPWNAPPFCGLPDAAVQYSRSAGECQTGEAGPFFGLRRFRGMSWRRFDSEKGRLQPFRQSSGFQKNFFRSGILFPSPPFT